MFSSIFESSADGTIDIRITMICVAVALVLGIFISGTYILLTRKRNCSEHFALTLVLLPAIVAIVIIMVGSNIARAFSIAGIFTLIRFRSVPGDAKDIMFVFLAAATGLSAGMGYPVFAVIITVMICIVLFIFGKLFEGRFTDKSKTLKILIPEDMSYQGVFDDLFVKYTTSSELYRIKTTNLGTLFELQYKVCLKADCNEKEFIDDIRCRNGNLNVMLTMAEQKIQQL